MALKVMDVTCDDCGAVFRQMPSRSWAGFLKLSCPHCDCDLTFPLTTGYRVTYWIFAIPMLVLFVSSLVDGDLEYLAGPGTLGGAVIGSLFKDWWLRKQLASADRTRGARSAGVRPNIGL